MTSHKPILIAHRGNLNGPNPSMENLPSYVEIALSRGYNCEIDVWYDETTGFSLGHDYGQYPVNEVFLAQPGLWCHSKNLSALHKMLSNSWIHCFWHQSDDFTLTSSNFIWSYPGKSLSLQSICVLPELNGLQYEDIQECYGICTDYPKWFK